MPKAKMAPLPNDVMLVIISHTDIDTFLSCRSLNRTIHDLINTHIHGLTKAVARSTFPRQTRILMQRKDMQGASAQECLRWLKGLRYEQLAAILLECGEKSSIAAEDPLGDGLRSHLVRGWKVLEHLAQIARDVLSLPAEELMPRELSQLDSLATDDARLRELEICAMRLEYIQTLSLYDLRSYWYLHKALPRLFGFSDPWTRQFRRDWSFRQGDPLSNVWVFSRVTKIGAQPFWRLWWANTTSSEVECKPMKKAIEATWTMTDKGMRQFERHGIDTIDFQVERMCHTIRIHLTSPTPVQKTPSEEIKQVLHRPTCMELWGKRLRLTGEGEPPPPFVLEVASLEQELMEDITRQVPKPRQTESDRFRSRRESRCATGDAVPEPAVMSEYKSLYREWYQAWREGRGWEKKVSELREKAERLASV